MKLRPLTTICLAAALAGVGAATVVAATPRKPKTTYVAIGDNFYSARAMKPVINGTVNIRTGDSVNWKWPDLGDTHDVRLKRPVPKGSPGRNPKTRRAYPALYSDDNPGGSYRYTFHVAGTYKIYCSFHSGEMYMTVKVTK